MPEALVETHEFRLHQRILVDIIKRQAGTPQKALLEGVMNCVDAGATEITLTIDFRRAVIQDNGQGFENEQVIAESFGQFGTPYTAAESRQHTYGRYRMGRGQMFALGKNVWTTGPYKMTVDVERVGISYTLEKTCEPVQGCRIEIDLYEPFDARGLVEVKREIARFTKYVQGAVTVNGERVSTDPATLKWGRVTDDAYFNIRAAENYGGIQLYNRGVFVCELPGYKWGLSGTVVSRKQLDVNFARNEVVQSCPVFKHIRGVLTEAADRNIIRKTVLSPEERISLITQLISGETAFYQHKNAQVFVDASGHGWSATNILRLKTNKSWTLTSANKIPFTFATPGLDADRILQEKRCLVLDAAVREWFEHTGEPAAFFENIKAYSLVQGLEYVPFESIRTRMDPTTWCLVPPREETQREALLLAALGHGSVPIRWALNSLGHTVDPRVLRIGQGEGARAWTDGETYIAIAQQYLQQTDTTIRGLTNLCNTMLHEYAHTSPDTAEHGHDSAFYRLFHDASDSIAESAHRVSGQYLLQLKRRQRRLARSHELRALKDAERQALETAVGVEPALVIESDPVLAELPIAADPRG